MHNSSDWYMKMYLQVCKKLVAVGVVMNELDGADGPQNGHNGVHHHNGHIDELHKWVLRVSHLEECNDRDDEVQRSESNCSTKCNEVAEEWNCCCNHSDNDNVCCGYSHPCQSVLEAPGVFVVVHHLLLDVKVRWTAVYLIKIGRTQQLNHFTLRMGMNEHT